MPRTGLVGVALGLVLGALFWARGRDPFERRWFTIKAGEGPRAACVAVLPKTAARPLPVVVYLHGSGGSLLQDGNDLRQMAELGLAAVGMDYCQTNHAVCEAQFAALLAHVRRQRWANTNAVAWIGFSLGAEKVTRFWLNHPEARPSLLVRLGGGWMTDVANVEAGRLKPREMGEHSPALSQAAATASGHAVLLVHGDQDEVFPVSDAERMAAAFRAKGVPVEVMVLAGQSHGLNPNRGAVFRALGEHCLTRLRGAEALGQYQSIASWQAGAWPLWIWWLPALLCGGGWALWRKNLSRRAERVRAGRWAWWVASGLALLALGLTAVHLGVPRLAVGDRAMAIARRFLVQPAEREDFDYLSSLTCWRGQRLGTVLEHVHLARYNRSLVNWRVDDAHYAEFILSPVIEGGAAESLRWRRMLWESLYPRVRKENSVTAASEAVVRHLRERVTVTAAPHGNVSVEQIWRRQMADTSGFERLKVAGLRSAGIPARLGGSGRAEIWNGDAWRPAPQAVIGIVCD